MNSALKLIYDTATCTSVLCMDLPNEVQRRSVQNTGLKLVGKSKPSLISLISISAVDGNTIRSTVRRSADDDGRSRDGRYTVSC